MTIDTGWSTERITRIPAIIASLERDKGMSVTWFQFDPNLIVTLGRQYRSCEEAIKELVANAWDADATIVEITLPQPMTTDPIIINDDGNGISPNHIQEHFMRVGYDRRQDRGETTPKGRQVRGSKGIGKFAGLQIAETMTVTTVHEHQQSCVVLNKDNLRSLVTIQVR